MNSARFPDILISLLFMGIPVYAVFRTVQMSSMSYISYFLWFFVAWALFTIIDKGKLNQEYKLLVLAAIWLSILGRLYLYENFLYYDKILHIITPFITACIAYDFLSRTLRIADKFHTFLLVAALLFLFEIFEYLLDCFQFFKFNTRGVYDEHGNKLMSPTMDTIIDLMLGLVTAIVALMIRSPQEK